MPVSGSKRISTRGAIALGIGSMVGAGIFALMGVAASMAGSAVWLSFLVAGVIALLTGHTHHYVHVHLPCCLLKERGLTCNIRHAVLP